MPRSVFLGRVVVPGEPLWLAEDRAWAVALLEYEADMCSGCGQPRSESMDAKHEEDYRPAALRCHACASIARASERFAATPHADTKGLMFGVHLKGGGHD